MKHKLKSTYSPGRHVGLVSQLLLAILFSLTLVHVASSAQNCVVPPPGLVSLWSAENNTADSAGTNTGTLQNGAGFAAGKVGQAFNFNGVNQYVRIPNNSSLTPTGSFTIEAWVFPLSSANNQEVLSKWGDGQVSYELDITTGFGLSFSIDDAANQGSQAFATLISTNNAIVAATWTHVAAVYDQSTGTRHIYANGIEITNRTQSPITIFNGTSAVGIGGTAGSIAPDGLFHGMIDEVSFYNRALSISEIQSIYNAGTNGKCAIPPTVTTQPQSQTVSVGNPVTFSVAVTGTQPLSYFWAKGTTNIPGATNATLTLSNVQLTNAGTYSVSISNAVGGSVLSSNALLTVVVPTCVTPPSGLVSWWNAETNTSDGAGTNNGTVSGNVAYAQGKVGKGFAFDGQGAYVALGNPANLQLQDFTIEGWVARNNSLVATFNGNAHGYFIAYVNSGYGFGMLDNGSLDLTKVGISEVSSSVAITDTALHHVAVTKIGSSVVFYVDGVAYPAASYNAVFSFTTTVSLGGINNGYNFAGTVDELSVYNRALSAAEIQSIFNASYIGKCQTAPVVITQPQSLTASVGNQASMSVVAAGFQPLIYQWRREATNLPGATTASLVLNNVQLTNTGNYSVTISNAIGGPILSSNAVLTVNNPACAPPPSGLVSWWNGQSNANDSFGMNNGTVNGNVTYASGKTGLGFVFDGQGAYVALGNPPSLQFQTLTIEGWVARGNLTFATFNGNAHGYFIAAVNSGYGFGMLDNGSLTLGKIGISEVTSSVAITDSNLHHVAVTKTGSTVVFYVDGVAYPAATFSASFTFTTTVSLGGINNGYNFVGLVDELSVYNRALSAGEIQTIYNASYLDKCFSPPVVVSQPPSQTVSVGNSATLSAGVTGNQPLTYQWQRDQTNLPGATAASLTFANAQLTNAGNYRLSVSNFVAGPVFSSNAQLKVTIPVCYASPSGLVSWWNAEGNTGDSAGTNTGTLQNGAGFAVGKVGQAFNFNGVNQYVRIPNNSSLTPTGSFTIEAWVFPLSSANNQEVLSKWGDGQVSYELNVTTGFGLSFSIDDAANQGSQSFATLISTNNAITAGTWTHLAAVYDQSTGTRHIYANGIEITNRTQAPITVFNGTSAVGIGGTAGSIAPDGLFHGMIDEVSFYNRALSITEIQGVYNASTIGKCPSPPVVVTQPQNRTVTAGGGTNITVLASGAQPLSYQWRLEQTNLPGATNASLVLTNIQPSMAGNYSVAISNNYDYAISSNAVLKVNVVFVLGNNVLLTNSQAAFGGSVTIKLTNVYPLGYIFYTLDGSTPTFASAQYTAPFVISNSCIIRTLGFSADFTQAGQSDPLFLTILPNYTLTTNTPGGGSISLNPTNALYISNSTVTATATPFAGWKFLQWLGDAGGTNASVNVLMNRNKSVQAIFGTALNTSAAGGGSVLLNPPGGFYAYGTPVQLSAVPQAGNFFVFWGTAASGNANPLTFSMTATNPSVSSFFAALGGGQVALTVVPLGHGQVVVNPQANSYATGQGVTVTATPDAGQSFLNWSGDANGTQNPLSVTMSQSKTIYANFSINHSLSLTLEPGGVREGVDLILNGEFGTAYRLDVSSNLVDWSTLFTLTNSVGSIHYIDTATTNASTRYYRGVPLP